MSELEDVADHLIVIGRGRLLADVSVEQLIASASGDHVEIRTPDPTKAMAVLSAEGAVLISNGSGSITVEGIHAMRVSEVLAANRVPLAELTSRRVTLEQAYFHVTRNAGEHTSVTLVTEPER
jgi:ABC-2 type transport system ATP-binding protein